MTYPDVKNGWGEKLGEPPQNHSAWYTAKSKTTKTKILLDILESFLKNLENQANESLGLTRMFL